MLIFPLWHDIPLTVLMKRFILIALIYQILFQAYGLCPFAYEHAACMCPPMAYAFRNPALSRSKCRYIQSLLQCAKANALRLNELSRTELMYIATLTPTQLVIFKWAIQADRPACMYNCKMIVNKNTQGLVLWVSAFQGIPVFAGHLKKTGDIAWCLFVNVIFDCFKHFNILLKNVADCRAVS